MFIKESCIRLLCPINKKFKLGRSGTGTSCVSLDTTELSSDDIDAISSPSSLSLPS